MSWDDGGIAVCSRRVSWRRARPRRFSADCEDRTFEVVSRIEDNPKYLRLYVPMSPIFFSKICIQPSLGTFFVKNSAAALASMSLPVSQQHTVYHPHVLRACCMA